MRAFQILAALKKFFAARAIETIGAVAHDAIHTTYIPRIQEKIDQAETEEERKKYQKLLELYEKYSNPNHSESKIYTETAAKIIQSFANEHNVGVDVADEIAQEIAANFYNKKLMNYLTTPEFKIEGGPLALNRLWASIINGQTKFILRTLHGRNPEMFQMERDNGLDPLSTIEAPEQFSESNYQKMISDLDKYMERNVKDDVDRIIWQRFWNVLDEKHDVNLDRDLVPFVSEKTGKSRTVIFDRFNRLQRTMARFFKEELDYEIPSVLKRKLHMASSEVLTYEFFRRRVAAWVLGLSTTN